MEQVTSLYWICGVDTESADADAHAPLIAAFGDSLINGDGSTPGAHDRFPDQLARRLGIPVLNLGISGNRLLRDGFGRSGRLAAGGWALRSHRSMITSVVGRQEHGNTRPGWTGSSGVGA